MNKIPLYVKKQAKKYRVRLTKNTKTGRKYRTILSIKKDIKRHKDHKKHKTRKIKFGESESIETAGRY